MADVQTISADSNLHPFDRQRATKVAIMLADAERKSLMQMCRESGAILLEEVWENRFEVFHKHGAESQPVTMVVEELHRMGRGGWNRKRVTRCVLLYEQDTVLGGLDKWPNLTPTHFFVVQQRIPLQDQAAVLEDADAQVLTVAELDAIVRKMVHERDPDPKTKPSEAQELFKTIERSRLALGHHDEWLASLHELGLGQDFCTAFDTSFNRFTGDLEDLILLLPEVGAQIPEDELDELHKRKQERMKPYTDAAKEKWKKGEAAERAAVSGGRVERVGGKRTASARAKVKAKAKRTTRRTTERKR